jgi:Uma2 family endonuclease
MAGMRAADPRVTFAELATWPDDGRRYELYEGEVIVVPAPNLRHQRIISELITVLLEYARQTGGTAVPAPFDIILSDYDVLQPDVVFFGPEKRAQLDPLDGAHIVPDLAVEVLSRSTEARDRGRKMALLARYDLPEYWLVDPATKTIEVFTRRADALSPVALFSGNQEVASPTLAGRRFPAERLFTD